MLERHIMQAQARAMSADERELNRANQSCDNYGKCSKISNTLKLSPKIFFKTSLKNRTLTFFGKVIF